MAKNNSEEILGTRFGRLVVVGFQKKKPPNRGWSWVCRCDCGNTHIASPNDIRNGKIKSCGCYHREASKKRAQKFENDVYSNKRLYSIYNGIKKRCYSCNEPRYRDYGARGIIMCDIWIDKECGFDNFVTWSNANGYDDTKSIDRIDVNGNYEPSNCRWISMKEQNLNKRCTKWVDYNGEHIQLKILCDRYKLKYDAIHNRIYNLGWSVNDAIEIPLLKRNQKLFFGKKKDLFDKNP
jgi:hypothetical protein